MIRILLTASMLGPVVGCVQTADAPIEAIEAVLNDFHDAAAKGDKTRYLGHLSADAVFLGTDEREWWPKSPDFTAYVDARFVNARGWTYEPLERHVRLSDGGDVAWFDEVVYSQENGRFRGTGVLVRSGEQWQIAHYALSFLIDNEDWDAVIELIGGNAQNSAVAESPGEDG